MRLCIERSNDLAPLPPFPFWLDCTTNTSGYDFRKGQRGTAQMKKPRPRIARPRLAFTEELVAGKVGTRSLNLLQRLRGHGLLMPSMKKAAP
jgi:hypothetical protein